MLLLINDEIVIDLVYFSCVFRFENSFEVSKIRKKTDRLPVLVHYFQTLSVNLKISLILTATVFRADILKTISPNNNYLEKVPKIEEVII